MERIRLGGTGLKVSPLAFGTMTLGNPVAEDTSLELLDFVVDQDINFIDTANGYNAGLSEEIIGKWMKARGNRERIVLATKVRYAVGGDPDTAGSTPKVIMREVENSLRRLNTDYIDIYYLHQPDDDTPIEITWRALESLVSSGKVRYIGVSNFAAWQIVESVNLARNRGWTPPTVAQALHNAAGKDAVVKWHDTDHTFINGAQLRMRKYARCVIWEARLLVSNCGITCGVIEICCRDEGDNASRGVDIHRTLTFAVEK